MLGRRHFYHVSPSGSTPHRSSLGYAHPPLSPWSQGDFTKPENEKSYTIKIWGPDEQVIGVSSNNRVAVSHFSLTYPLTINHFLNHAV